MSHIFISYSRRNLDIAQRIVDALAKNKMDVWIDWKSIPKGEDWEQEIYRGIEAAEAFLFLVSADSVASEMCNKEILHAVKNGKRILPVFIGDVDNRQVYGTLDKFLLSEAKTEIGRRNFIYCRDGMDDFDRAIAEIGRTIHTDYDWIKFHTELQIKALRWERKKDASRLLRGKELKESAGMVTRSRGKEPALTDLQTRYLGQSKRKVLRQRATVAGVLSVVFLLAVWWDKTWFRVWHIPMHDPAITRVFVDVQGLDALPADIAKEIDSIQNERSGTGTGQTASPNDTVTIKISPAQAGKVSITLALPKTPAYSLDFLPEIRAFQAEEVRAEEIPNLLRGAIAYAEGKYSEAVKALKGTKSLGGHILLAQAYLFTDEPEKSREVYKQAIGLAEEQGKDAGQIRMGAALAWWMPNLSQTQTGSSSRSSTSTECVNAYDLYTAGLSSPNTGSKDRYIFQIAAYYCGNADWAGASGMTITPAEDNPYSVFARILPRLGSNEIYDPGVMESLRQTGQSIVYARYELAWYALLHNGKTMLCNDFVSARDWYAEGAVTEIDRNNVRSLLRMSCEG